MTAAAQAPTIVRDAWNQFTGPWHGGAPRELSFVTNSEQQGELRAALKEIPPRVRYTIVFGDAPPVDPNVQASTVPLFSYVLLPRIYVSDLADAQWVIAYHHASETIGVPYKKELNLGPYVNTFAVTK